jgi:hypothetical protein
MRLVIASRKITFDRGFVQVSCAKCHHMHDLEVRKMTGSDLMRNQPWCSECRSKAAVDSKNK